MKVLFFACLSGVGLLCSVVLVYVGAGMAIFYLFKWEIVE